MTKRVLVVDDEAGWRQLIQTDLESLGCEVDLAHDYLSAEELIDANDYVLIVLDNTMGDINDVGLDLLQYIRQLGERNIKTPVILHTGDDRMRTRARVKALEGIFHYKGDHGGRRAVLRAVLEGRLTPEVTGSQ